MLYVRHGREEEREVTQQAAKPTTGRGKMTVEDLVARETVIERQEEAHVKGVSMDTYATNAFQLYASDMLGFTIERAGIMYGVVTDDMSVRVDFIYEPHQENYQEGFNLIGMDGEEHGMVDAIAGAQGYDRVGLIFSRVQESREGYTLSEKELLLAADLQSRHGGKWVTALMSPLETEEGTQANVEAFQISDQCIKLWHEGSLEFKDASSEGYDPAKVKCVKEVKIKHQETHEIDCDLFLVPVPISGHQGPLRASFPVENRLVAQTQDDLRSMLQRHADKPYHARLADFHLLLFLAKLGGLARGELASLSYSVIHGFPIDEGHKLIIDSLAGI